MKYRQSLSRKKSSKMFSRGASRTQSINLATVNPVMMRGGTRL